MEQKAKIQTEYWNLFKTSPWHQSYVGMPKYFMVATALGESGIR